MSSMMTRYYYDDPLAAAWMAKHFDMKFQMPVPENYPNIIMRPLDIKNFRDGTRIDVDSDSLHILEPKDGDIGFDGRIFKGGLWGEGVTAYPQRYGGKVIYRNGIAFMWPKEETVPLPAE